MVETTSEIGTPFTVKGPKPISVNMPIWPTCNYRCKFCFGHYRGLMREFRPDRIMEIPSILVSMGTEKITLEGGEPFLYPELKDFLKVCKEAGLITSAITNGSLVEYDTLQKMSPYLDWIGVSIDSPNEETEKLLGRCTKNCTSNHVEKAIRVVGWAQSLGIKVKVNTVVTKYNVGENLVDLYLTLRPERIKVFQFLPIENENDEYADELEITREEFEDFKNRHKILKEMGYNIVFESNEDMKGSYLMLFPSGRFLNNNHGKYIMSEETLFTNSWKALEESKWEPRKFEKRGGRYEW